MVGKHAARLDSITVRRKLHSRWKFHTFVIGLKRLGSHSVLGGRTVVQEALSASRLPKDAMEEEFNVDGNFSNAIGAFITVDPRTAPAAILERYMRHAAKG
jgi:hypothetical protein